MIFGLAPDRDIKNKNEEVTEVMTGMKRWSLSIALTLVFSFAAATMAMAAPSADDLMKQVNAKWDKTNTYTCELFQWGYKTPSFIKNFPEHRDKDGADKPGWGYRVFKVRFKKPDLIMLKFVKSLNEDLKSGDIIDQAVAHVLAYIPGTTFLYGYEDAKKKISKKTVYIIFPYISDSKFNSLPLPADKKATMKTLMIASRQEFYFKDPQDLKDDRGNLMTELSIDKKIDQFAHYFKDGKVTVKEAKIPQESDYTLDKKKGWITLKSPSGQAGYIMTMIPGNVGKNRGVTKAEVFVDKTQMMFVGLHEYEKVDGKERLVQVMILSDLKLNSALEIKDWTDMFKGRKLSDKG